MILGYQQQNVTLYGLSPRKHSVYIEMYMHAIAHVLIFMCIIRTKGLHVVNGDKLSICVYNVMF